MLLTPVRGFALTRALTAGLLGELSCAESAAGRRSMSRSMVRGSVPTNIFVESPDMLLVDPDTEIPKTSLLNPLAWSEKAKFKTKQATTRKKIFLDIQTAEATGKSVDYEKKFNDECLELYQMLCQGRFQCVKNKVKLATTRKYGDSVMLSSEFVRLQEILAKYPGASIDWKILKPTQEILFAAFAQLGNKAMPLDFAQITVKFESEQSVTFIPDPKNPPTPKPFRKIVDRYVFERCTSRKGSAWHICHRLPDVQQ